MPAPDGSINPGGADQKLDPKRMMSMADTKLVEYLTVSARGYVGIKGAWIWQDKLRRAQFGTPWVESQYTISFLKEANGYRYGEDVRLYLMQYIKKYVPYNDPSWAQTSDQAVAINAAQGQVNKAINAIQDALIKSGMSTSDFVKTQTWRDLQGKKMIAQDQLDTAKGIARSTSCVDYQIIASGAYGDELIQYFSKEIAHCQALQASSDDQNVRDGLKRPDSYTTDTPILTTFDKWLPWILLGSGVFGTLLYIKKSM